MHLVPPRSVVVRMCSIPGVSRAEGGHYLCAGLKHRADGGGSLSCHKRASARGEANQAIAEYVAGILELRKHQVSLSKASAKSREKVLHITGLDAKQALDLLRKAAA